MKLFTDEKWWWELGMSRGQWYHRYYLCTEHWKIDIPKMLFDFYPHKCMICSESRSLQLHHNNYLHLYHETVFDLLPVCRRCHKSLPFPDRSKGLKEVEELVIGCRIGDKVDFSKFLKVCEEQRKAKIILPPKKVDMSFGQEIVHSYQNYKNGGLNNV